MTTSHLPEGGKCEAAPRSQDDLVIRADTRSTSLHASAQFNPADQRLSGDLLFQAWQTFSVKINILRVWGPLASVSTLVGVQKVHEEPVSGRQ